MTPDNWLNSSVSKYDYICRPCRNIKSKQWKDSHPERVYEIYKKYSVKKRYDLDWEGFIKLFDEQNRSCKICHTGLDLYAKSTHVDHDHKTGKVRGILCHNCNTGLGKFQDNIHILEQAIQYLNENNFN